MENTENSKKQTAAIPEQENSAISANKQLPLKKRKNKNRKLAGW